MLNVIMLNVANKLFGLSVFMLNVVAPKIHLFKIWCSDTELSNCHMDF
jgi:hypothetical protein